MKNEIALRPSYWASVSGGKDSLLMLKLILSNRARYPLDGVVHFELEIDYPFIKNVIDYMQQECEKYGIKFVRIKPRTSWFELYNKYLFPTRMCRWCNNSYKLDAKRQLDEFIKSQGAYTVYYIGYCKDEVKRYLKRTNTKEIYPLVELGIVEEDVLRWAKGQPIFNSYYKTQRRCGCMFCPMASRINLAYLLKYYPDKYSELMAMTKETEIKRSKELNRKFSVWASNPKYDTDYVDNNVRTKWLPILEQKEE